MEAVMFTSTELSYLWLALERECRAHAEKVGSDPTCGQHITAAFLLEATRKLQHKVWELREKAIADEAAPV